MHFDGTVLESFPSSELSAEWLTVRATPRSKQVITSLYQVCHENMVTGYIPHYLDDVITIQHEFHKMFSTVT